MITLIELLLGLQSFESSNAYVMGLPNLGWLLIIINIMTASFYFVLLYGLLYCVSQFKNDTYKVLFLVSAAFVLATGVNFILDGIAVWMPVETWQIVIKAFIAVVALGLVLLGLPFLKLFFSSKLDLALQLDQEIAAHKKTREELRQLNEGLDKIVELRVEELKELNQEVNENKEKYELLLNTVDDGIYGLDLDGNTTFINPAACRMFECKEEDILGQPAENLLNTCPNIEKFDEKTNRKTLAIIESKGLSEHKNIAKNESILCIKNRCIPVNFTRTVLKKDDHISGHVVIFRDISEHKRTEGLLIQAKNTAELARQHAEEANKAKSQFLSRMSHELRTPMNAILGFAQLLDDDDITEEQHDDVKEILSAGNHLMELINEVLELAKIESGKLEIHIEEVNLNSIMSSSLSLTKAMADKNNIQCIDNITQETDFVLKADRVRLKQVLVNLLSNSIKYNVKGGTVTVFCEEVANKIRISVRDTGRGMTPEQVAHLFQPFERLGASDSTIEGTGIGLVITKNIVELMQGRISVQSVLEEGTVFSIELPLA